MSRFGSIREIPIPPTAKGEGAKVLDTRSIPPSEVWEHFERLGSEGIVGEIAPGSNWYAVRKGRSYVSGEGDVDGMVAYRDPAGEEHTMDKDFLDFKPKEFQSVTEFAQKFIQRYRSAGGQTYVGFNSSQNPFHWSPTTNEAGKHTSKGSHSASWHNLHLHVVHTTEDTGRPPENTAEIKSLRRRTIEHSERLSRPFYHLLFARLQDMHPEYSSTFTPSTDQTQAFPIGGLRISYPESTDARLVTYYLQDLVRSFRDEHERLFRLFATNYGDVKSGGYRYNSAEYTKPDERAIQGYLHDLPTVLRDNSNTKEALTLAIQNWAKVLKPSSQVPDEQKHLWLGPAFSLALRPGTTSGVGEIVLKAHLFSNAGTVEMLGTDLKRIETPGTPMSQSGENFARAVRVLSDQPTAK